MTVPQLATAALAVRYVVRAMASRDFVERLFGLDGQVAVVTGGTGVLGGTMARGLAGAGARVGVLGRREANARQVVSDIQSAGGEAMPLAADVLDGDQLLEARTAILDQWGSVDILVNAAGGNQPDALVADDAAFFDASLEAFDRVMDLNLRGTVLASQIFADAMARRSDGDQARGSIVNISSMAARHAMSRVMAYSIAKGGVDNFTIWLALELARKYGAGMRVNAIAPGFFLGEQNRALLVNEDGSLTARGEKVIGHTPAGRFGEADELIGTLIWLCSPAAAFVTGVIVPVDGGFSMYSGV
jgi:NAD(P)-dependent dehydrogenase (short-subunit alcohol dehydrogenase family)